MSKIEKVTWKIWFTTSCVGFFMMLGLGIREFVNDVRKNK